MLPGDPSFERSIRRAALRRIKSSPDLTRQYRSRPRLPFTFERPAFIVPLLLIGVAAVAIGTMHEHYGLALLPLSIYSIYFVVSRAAQLRTLLYNSPERLFSRFYPLEDSVFFPSVIGPFLFRSLFIWCVASIVYLALTASRLSYPIAVALAFSTIFWLAILLSILLLSLVIHRLPRWILPFVKTAALVTIFTFTHLPPSALSLEYFSPAGWLHRYFLVFSESPSYWGLAAALLAAAVSVTLCLQMIRTRILGTSPGPYFATAIPMDSEASDDPSSDDHLHQQTVALSENSSDPAVVTKITPRDQQAQITRDDSDLIANFIRSGVSLLAWDWSRTTWLELVISRWLTDQERDLLEFLLGGSPPRWSANWKSAVLAAAVSVACFSFPGPFLLIFAIIAGIVSFWLAVMERFPGMGPYYLAARLSPIHALFPIDYTDFLRTFLKLKVVRILSWLPIGLMLSAFLGWRVQTSIAVSVLDSLNLVLCSIASLPLFAAAHFSRSTGDSQGFRLAPILFTVLAKVASLGNLLVIFLLVFSGSPLALLAPLAAAALSLSAWALYGRYYASGRFDLFAKPKSR